MTSTSATRLPSLPTETWAKILVEHSLSFHDLKRVARVSKELKSIVEAHPPPRSTCSFPRSPLDVLLPKSTQVALHPVLLAGWSFIENSTEAFEVRDASYEKCWKICNLTCATDFATTPPVTSLGLGNIGRDRLICYVQNQQRVRVLDVLNRIAKRWNEQPHPDCIAMLQMNLFGFGQLNGGPSEGNLQEVLNLKVDTYYDLLREYSDHQFWEGWEGVWVGAKGIPVARACALGS